MLNTLKIATDGYLKRTAKAVLVISVAGYLSFGGITPTENNLADGYIKRSYSSEQIIENSKRQQLLEEDEIILTYVQTFVKLL